MRRRLPLGATARLGPRTGVLEVDWGKMATAAAEVVDKFRACGKDDEVVPVGGRGSVITTVRDAASGKDREVGVWTIPVSDDADVPNAQHRRLRDSHGAMEYEVVLFPRHKCMSADNWRWEMRRSLVHELTHASEADRQKLRQHPRFTEGCRYFNSRWEVAAFVAEAREEMGTFQQVRQADFMVRKGFLTRPEDLLMLASPTYQDLIGTKCLTPENRRRFLKMAAHLWEQRGYQDLAKRSKK